MWRGGGGGVEEGGVGGPFFRRLGAVRIKGAGKGTGRGAASAIIVRALGDV